MVIRSLEVSADFQYLWLKRITGINLEKHCAQCLLGEYDPRVSPLIPHQTHLELVPGIFYLCGVSRPYVWANNFHIAFRDGSEVIDYQHNGVHVIIDGAERLPISPDSAKVLMLPKYKYSSYRTCRNWQFANYLYDAGIFKG